MHSILAQLRQELSFVSDPEKASQMAAYMKGQFRFFGVQSKQRKDISNRIWKDNKTVIIAEFKQICIEAWQCDEREVQYTAMDWLGKLESSLELDDLAFIESLIKYKSWWDTVDFLASHGVGQILKSDQEVRRNTCERYLESGNMWLHRTALIFQLMYKENTDEELLLNMIVRSLGSSEFFINKAIGWALRQYSKIYPEAVRQFVDKHSPDMAGLSIREASKYL
jgi:3-methyladenine DNA glycosylase AlkD